MVAEGDGASEAVQSPAMGWQPELQGSSAFSSELSKWFTSWTWIQRRPSRTTDTLRHQTLWEESPWLEFRWIDNSFDEHIKEVGLYFPLHIIKEQVLDNPSLLHNATYTGVLRANIFCQSNPRFSPWGTMGLVTLQTCWLYSDSAKQKLVHCCRFSTRTLVISGRLICRGGGEIFSWAELFS